MVRRLFIIPLLLSGILPATAGAWNDTGHMIVASVAWTKMYEGLQTRWSSLLKHHPAYPSWMQMYDRTSSGVDTGLFLFMRASTWPDDIKKKGHPDDHPTWHYINYPLVPRAFPFEEPRDTSENILFAIDSCRRVLADTSAPPDRRAVALSWLIHLVGDLHQPLHTTAWFDERFPKGDRGGNDWYFVLGDDTLQLHGFWDHCLGSEVHPRTILENTNEIFTRVRNEDRELDSLVGIRAAILDNEPVDPRTWAIESRQMAINIVYLSGVLRGSPRRENAPRWMHTYRPVSTNSAGRFVLKAGWRLFNLLQTV